jgi:hypothetical protein
VRRRSESTIRDKNTGRLTPPPVYPDPSIATPAMHRLGVVRLISSHYLSAMPDTDRLTTVKNSWAVHYLGKKHGKLVSATLLYYAGSAGSAGSSDAGSVFVCRDFLDAVCRSMTMIVMLSPPIPCVTLGSSLMIASSISAPISVGNFSSMRSCTYFTAFSLERQSQIPSQPRIMNSSSGSNLILRRCEW